ncbi:hypothetical protein [Bacteroides sp. Marseille-P3684]|uniref:hypothetical protein n=1 Tax=Bacteroides sp. Marseille-P3684 TaxID=2086579 RepID=UPI000D112C05|nr:hypothetical protein [Bacteroides sp. Marseille-P3684]
MKRTTLWTCLAACFLLLGLGACSKDEIGGGGNEPDGETFKLRIRASIVGLGRMAEGNTRVATVTPAPEPVDSAHYFDVDADADAYDQYVSQYNLVNYYEDFVGNIHVFLLNDADNILMHKRFVSSLPKEGEDVMIPVSKSGSSGEVLYYELHYDMPDKIAPEVINNLVKRIVLVANEPFSADGSTSLFGEEVKGLFSDYAKRTIDNPIRTEADLRKAVQADKRPYGLTMIGSVDFTGNLQSWNENPVQVKLYRNMAKVVVDIVHENSDTNKAEELQYILGTELVNAPAKIQVASPLFADAATRPEPFWTGLPATPTETYTNEVQVTTLKGTTTVYDFSLQTQSSIRRTYYIPPASFRTVDKLPSLKIYTSYNESLMYREGHSAAEYSDKTYVIPLPGGSADTDKFSFYANRLNYYRMTYKGDRPDYYRILFAPLGGDYHLREVVVRDEPFFNLDI